MSVCLRDRPILRGRSVPGRHCGAGQSSATIIDQEYLQSPGSSIAVNQLESSAHYSNLSSQRIQRKQEQAAKLLWLSDDQGLNIARPARSDDAICTLDCCPSSPRLDGLGGRMASTLGSGFDLE